MPTYAGRRPKMTLKQRRRRAAHNSRTNRRPVTTPSSGPQPDDTLGTSGFFRHGKVVVHVAPDGEITQTSGDNLTGLPSASRTLQPLPRRLQEHAEEAGIFA